MDISEIRPHIFQVRMENRYKLTSTFMRLQEYYESPNEKIRGRFFTLEEFMDACAEMTGNFTYTSDWSGFNVPGGVVLSFFNIFWNDLQKKEMELYRLLSPVIPSSSPNFYLIGVFEDVSILHEVAHGYYYLDEEYRDFTNKLVREWPHTESFKRLLMDKGYCEHLIVDEIQAYLACTPKRRMVEKLKFDPAWEIPEDFKMAFDAKELKHLGYTS